MKQKNIYQIYKHIYDFHYSNLILMLFFLTYMIRFPDLQKRLAQHRFQITQAHEEGPNILGGNVHRMPRGNFWE